MAQLRDQASAEAIVSGSLDDSFEPFSKAPGHNTWRDYWLKIIPQNPPEVEGPPDIILNATRGLHADLLAFRNGAPVTLPLITHLPAFLGGRDHVFILPEGVPSAQPLYAHMTSDSNDPQYLPMPKCFAAVHRKSDYTLSCIFIQ